MAKKAVKDRTPERIQQDIEDRRERIRGLEGEIATLEEEALTPIRALAEQMGFRLVRPGRAGKRRGTARSTTADIAEWLRQTLRDGPMPKKELSEVFARDGLGTRLRLAKYVKEGVVSLDDKTDQVALV